MSPLALFPGGAIVPHVTIPYPSRSPLEVPRLWWRWMTVKRGYIRDGYAVPETWGEWAKRCLRIPHMEEIDPRLAHLRQIERAQATQGAVHEMFDGILATIRSHPKPWHERLGGYSGPRLPLVNISADVTGFSDSIKCAADNMKSFADHIMVLKAAQRAAQQ